jgi:hypothetical protein
LVVGLKYLIAAGVCVAYCFAQDTEIGGAIGYGVYRDGSIYAPGGKTEAGIRNRFAAGAVFGEDLYDHLSGEIRYLYHDGHAFLSARPSPNRCRTSRPCVQSMNGSPLSAWVVV